MTDVDQLLLNARLRDEIEPFLDESLVLIDSKRMSIDLENQFLESMLAWERAPVLPIGQWFEPEIRLPSPETLGDEQLHQHLHQVLGRLYEKNIVLEFTDHLSDRQLVCLIMRDILPAQEKRVSISGSQLRWQCIDEVDDAETWLKYYATDRQRTEWSESSGRIPPPKSAAPHPRRLPGLPHRP